MNIVLFTDANGMHGWGRDLGSYRIATELRRNNFTVQVVDIFSNWTLDELKIIVDKFIDQRTLYVGFSTTLMVKEPISSGGVVGTAGLWDNQLFSKSDEEVDELFRYIRSKNHKVKIVIGGAKTRLFKQLSTVDYWVVGDGDNSAVAIAKHLRYGTPLLVVDGKVEDYNYPYNMTNGDIKWEENDFLFHDEQVSLEIKRGCRFKCAFCSRNKPILNYSKSMNTLKSELIRNYNEFGIQGYMITDSTLNENMKEMKDLHKVFTKLPFQIEFYAFLRLDMITRYPEMGLMLKEMGLKSTFFGIETFHEKAAKNVGKHISKEETIDTLMKLRDIWPNIRITTSFIIGLPYESKESIWDTFNWLNRPDSPIDGFLMIPLYLGKEKCQIDLFPEHYGITKLEAVTLSGNINWKTDQMTFLEAKEICKEMWDIVRTKNFTKRSTRPFSRYRNLGYTLEDSLNWQSWNEEDLVMRRNKLVQEYKSKVLN